MTVLAHASDEVQETPTNPFGHSYELYVRTLRDEYKEAKRRLEKPRIAPSFAVESARVLLRRVRDLVEAGEVDDGFDMLCERVELPLRSGDQETLNALLMAEPVNESETRC